MRTTKAHLYSPTSAPKYQQARTNKYIDQSDIQHAYRNTREEDFANKLYTEPFNFLDGYREEE